MEDLSKSLGGHGNGYATSKGGAVRGEKLTERACADALHSTKHAAVWHTRLCSVGSVCDELCHPFATTKGCYLVHNGTWSQGSFTARCLKGKWSDTAVAALFIRLYGWDEFVAQQPSGVWLHLTPRGVAVHYSSGSLMVDVNTGALASEGCDRWGDWHTCEYGTYGVGKRPRAVQAWTVDSRSLFSGGAQEVWEPCSHGVGRSATMSTEKSDRGISKFIG
jgi:hypothetical protein